jgi:hypothetical protein
MKPPRIHGRDDVGPAEADDATGQAEVGETSLVDEVLDGLRGQSKALGQFGFVEVLRGGEAGFQTVRTG